MTTQTDTFVTLKGTSTRTTQADFGKTSILLAIALGLSLFFAVGLAQSSHLHNAAHDSRHSMGFPCH